MAEAGEVAAFVEAEEVAAFVTAEEVAAFVAAEEVATFVAAEVAAAVVFAFAPIINNVTMPTMSTNPIKSIIEPADDIVDLHITLR